MKKIIVYQASALTDNSSTKEALAGFAKKFQNSHPETPCVSLDSLVKNHDTRISEIVTEMAGVDQDGCIIICGDDDDLIRDHFDKAHVICASLLANYLDDVVGIVSSDSTSNTDIAYAVIETIVLKLVEEKSF